MGISTYATRYGRAVPVLAVMVIVAALFLGMSAMQRLNDVTAGGGQGNVPDGVARTASESTYDLDVGPVSDPAQIDACAGPDFAADPSEVEVLYGVLQRRPSGTSPVLVLRNAAGDVRLCDHFGADSPSQAPLPTASQQRPVVFFSNGRSAWKCEGTGQVLDQFQMTSWLAVSPRVDEVQQRYTVDGVTGPWFTTKAQGGFVHLQSWLDGPQPADTTYAVQYRVRDASGGDVRQTALPTRPNPLAGCSGGSAEIG